MLEIARDSFNLKDFETRLQHHLEELFGGIIPITVNCVVNENHLLILIQAETSTSLSSAKVFPEINKILVEESIPEFFEFQMSLMANAPQSETSSIPQSFEQVLEPDLKTKSALLPPVTNILKKQILTQIKFNLSNHSSKRIAGIGVGIILLLGGIYGVTRPCSMGSCQLIAQSQHSAQEAIAFFETSPSSQNIAVAQQRLTEALKQLKRIPWWSSYHSQAGSLMSLYQTRLDSLNQLIMALEKATEAVKIAQDIPLSVSQWSKVKQLWEEAIASLNQLPPESPFFSFSQAKKREYQSHLTDVQNQLQAEKQAQVSLEEAQKAAKIAQMRQNAAQSLQDWQLVHATWQTTIKRLEEIASGTTPHQQGQQLLKSYLPLLTKSGTRLQQEKLAQQYYQQAIKEAEFAEKSQQSQQWSQAVSYWRKALTSLKQIQANTFTASQAQPLINNYIIALNQAEINFKNVFKLQQIRQNLEEICKGIQKICQYQITQNSIKINLTPAYMEQVWQTALQAKAQANIQIQIDLLNHISRLEQTWQAISKKTKKTVEIYNPQGELMVIYEPIKN